MFLSAPARLQRVDSNDRHACLLGQSQRRRGPRARGGRCTVLTCPRRSPCNKGCDGSADRDRDAMNTPRRRTIQPTINSTPAEVSDSHSPDREHCPIRPTVLRRPVRSARRHERPTRATLNYLPTGGMQMIWSGALIEHGWSAPCAVGSEVTVCHRELPAGAAWSRQTPPVTDNHHPPRPTD